MDLKIVDDDGKEIAWDGSTQGDLYCKEIAVVKRYLKMDELAVDMIIGLIQEMLQPLIKMGTCELQTIKRCNQIRWRMDLIH